MSSSELLYTLLLVGWGLTLAAGSCPPTIKCITSDTTKTCEERGLHYRENVLFDGCCPGCVKLTGKNETCADSTECIPGYKCNDTEEFGKVCIEDPAQACEAERRKASDTKAWMPECLPDGSYAPKQCKGEPTSGRCFCYNPQGVRIFGEEKWESAQNMTCGCSRLMWETLQERGDVSLHCTDQGNFEELQCDAGVCWCGHEITGEPFSVVVPENMLKALPCYDKQKHGDQYLRQCDSQRVSQFRARQLLAIHGTDNVNFAPVTCNYDGSYARVQINSSDKRKVCVTKDGNPTPNRRSSEISDVAMDCNCDYDGVIAIGEFNFQCQLNGNYATVQYAGDKAYCVDSDGYYTPVCPPNQGKSSRRNPFNKSG